VSDPVLANRTLTLALDATHVRAPDALPLVAELVRNLRTAVPLGEWVQRLAPLLHSTAPGLERLVLAVASVRAGDAATFQALFPNLGPVGRQAVARGTQVIAANALWAERSQDQVCEWLARNPAVAA
jgi:hypothetical protein